MTLDGNRKRHVIIVLLLVIFVVVMLRSAWVCDDAYITLRTVDNIVNGYGPVWNVGERVQAYTHPLWMFILTMAYLVTTEAFLTTIVVGMLCSLAALTVFAFRIAPSLKMAVFGLLILILSKFFVDYSTAGLENPLTHLLLTLFFVYYFFRDISVQTVGGLAVIASLLMLTRLDLILLVLPALGYAMYRTRRWASVGYAVLGFLPLIIWELFSFWYYGSLIPNTAYAKLNTGIPKWDLMVQGAHYLEAALRGDRLMVLIIVGTLGYTIWRNGKLGWPVAGGIVLYIVYVVSCGGCFMAGRFFTGPLFAAVLLLSQHTRLLNTKPKTAGAFALILVIGLTSAYSPVYSGPNYGVGDKRGLGHGIDDCRHFYFQHSGLWTADGWQTEPDHKWVTWGRRNRREGTTAIRDGGIGFLGYYSGPRTHIVDVHALSDPFLARFPAAYDKLWRIGHFVRAIPDGYMETVASGENHIVDSGLSRFYDTLQYVISGPLWSAQRITTAISMQLGEYDRWLQAAGDVRMSMHLHELSSNVPDGAAWTSMQVHAFPGNGLRVYLDTTWHADSVEISLDGNDSYSVLFGKRAERLGDVEIHPKSEIESGTATYTVAVPREIRETGYDRLTLQPLTGDGIYAVGHITALHSKDVDDGSR